MWFFFLKFFLEWGAGMGRGGEDKKKEVRINHSSLFKVSSHMLAMT